MSKWTKEEELDLIKDIANGLQIENIAIKRNRSNSAIELRLKKIIFENIVAGRTSEIMSKKLHLPIERINQYFYAYKDFKEKHSGNTENIANLKINNSDMFGENEKNHTVFSKLHKEIQEIKEIQLDEKENNKHAQTGGSKIGNLENKIKQLELENKLINLIVENKQLNSQLNKLIKEGKVDKNIKIAIKNIREKKIV